jgi:hypothetical protein
MNCFRLIDNTQQQSSLLQSFLDTIGQLNASYLSHLCVEFPVTERVNGEAGSVGLREDSQQKLELSRVKCAKLSTLVMIVHSKNCDIFRRTEKDLQEALLLIDAQFKTMPSLDRILVRVVSFDMASTASARDFMQTLGWVVSANGSWC